MPLQVTLALVMSGVFREAGTLERKKNEEHRGESKN